MTSDYTPEEADEPLAASDYRTYEVYQRERVGETTNLVDPRALIADEYLHNPFEVPSVLRENYPCFRDWISNRFWVTRYDDVTSVFVDDANYESRPPSRSYGAAVSGRDLGATNEFIEAWVGMSDAGLEAAIARVLDELDGPTADLATGFADQLAAHLLSTMLGLSDDSRDLLTHLAAIKAGTGWNEQQRSDGYQAFDDAVALVTPHLADRAERPAGDLLTTFADLDASPADVIVTLVNHDLATLPASVANLWCLLLTHREQFSLVKNESRLMKFAYLEALRHSPPLPTADRFTRHEVERFGRLLPQGALIHLSAAAANRDPRQFENPGRFDIGRKDLCQREPRGHYRADGLPAGIAFGHGKPSRLPAVPRDTVRSTYALTRDIAVAASNALLERFPNLQLAADADPSMALDRLGGTYRCRSLPVQLG